MDTLDFFHKQTLKTATAQDGQYALKLVLYISAQHSMVLRQYIESCSPYHPTGR